MLASVSVDLAQYVGKVHEDATLPITSGRIKNGKILDTIDYLTSHDEFNYVIAQRTKNLKRNNKIFLW